MFRSVCALSVLLVAVTAHAEDPPWLKEARAKEAKAGTVTTFASEDGWFKARVPGKAVGKIVKEQGSYSVELDIGADSSLYCEVIPDGMDMAEQLRATFANLLKVTNEAGQKVEASGLELVDAGSWDEVAHLNAHWLYRVHDGKQRLLVGLRQYAFEKVGHGVYCGLGEIGYTRTLATVMKSLAETIEFKESSPAPYYSEITAWKAGDKVAGIVQMRLDRDADGDTRTTIEFSMLAPSGETAQARDSFHREWVRPDGSLINAVHVKAKDGQLASDLSLKLEDDRWNISGQHEGKTLATKLPEGAEPGTVLKQMLDLRRVMSAQNPVGAEHTIGLWDSEDLTTLTETKTRITRRLDERLLEASAQAGKFNVTLHLEKATGSTVFGESAMLGTTVRFQRVHTTGKF